MNEEITGNHLVRDCAFLCQERNILLVIHSANRMQSWNLYSFPAQPRTTMAIPPGKTPIKLYPPPILLPVLPPKHPSPNNLLLFSITITLVLTSPSSSMSLVLIVVLIMEAIFDRRGILKHYAAILATSSAEAVFPMIPWGFDTTHSSSSSSFTNFLILCMKADILASLLQFSRSKQLKYCLFCCLIRQLPRLFAIAIAMLLAETIISEYRASCKLIMFSQLQFTRNMLPPTLLSMGRTRISKVVRTRKYYLTMSYAVQKVRSFEREAMSWEFLYLQPLTTQ